MDSRPAALLQSLVPMSSGGNTPFYDFLILFLAPDCLYAQGFRAECFPCVSEQGKCGCDGSTQLSAFIDIHRQHGKQCHESNQDNHLLSEATHNPIRPLRVNRLSSSFLFFRFDILVDGYTRLDRNIVSLISTGPSPWYRDGFSWRHEG